MRWPELIRGTLIKRYQRFKADVRLGSRQIVTAFCPNTGSMLACSEPGRTVYLSAWDLPHRKLKYTWEIIEMPTSLVGINTSVPNKLVRESALAEQIPELKGYDRILSEIPYGRNSRIDLLFERGDRKCFVEIKNCTFTEEGTAFFPDAVTSRGLKHLKELSRQVRSGHRSVMFYLVQRMDAGGFKPADHIDPEYGRELRKAVRAGVEILVYDVTINLKEIRLSRSLPYELSSFRFE